MRRSFVEFSGWLVILVLAYVCASMLVGGVVSALLHGSVLSLLWGLPAVVAAALVLAIRKNSGGTP